MAHHGALATTAHINAKARPKPAQRDKAFGAADGPKVTYRLPTGLLGALARIFPREERRNCPSPCSNKITARNPTCLMIAVNLREGLLEKSLLLEKR
jgi:hypothetical protein